MARHMERYLRRIAKMIGDPALLRYAKRLHEPRMLQKFIWIFLRSMTGYVFSLAANKFGPSFQRRIVKRRAVSLDHNALKGLPPYDLIEKQSEKGRLVIKLATMETDLDQSLFDAKYEDEEDLFAANRFYWIFPLLHERSDIKVHSAVKQSILDWIKTHPRPENIGIFEPYSVSERCIAWLTFLCFAKGRLDFAEEDLSLVTASIGRQLRYLIDNLEFRGAMTNNHVLNDARCLYFCGIAFGDTFLKSTARAVLSRYFDKIIIDGCLNEGSSHYQHLITMKFLELLKLAERKGDRQAIEWLRPRVGRMLGVCGNLQSEHDSDVYPLFGDTSPDVTPKWLSGWPFSKERARLSNWCGLFGSESVPASEVRDQRRGFRKLSKGAFEVWLVTKDNGMGCHGHHDNASFVLYYQGIPIIADPGLFSYAPGAVADLQRSSSLHGGPVTGALWDPPKNTFVSHSGLRSSVKVRQERDSVECDVVSFDDALAAKRTIEMGDEVVAIRDRVVRDIFGNKAAGCLLCLYPSVEPEEMDDGVFIPCVGLRITTNADMKIENTPFSGKYGSLCGTKSIVISYLAETELKIKFERLAQ